MRILSCVLFLSLFLLACNESTPKESPAENTETDPIEKEIFVTDTSKDPPCLTKDASLPGNWINYKEEQQLVAILAGAQTNDPDFGAGHRTLAIYQTESCTQVHELVLPKPTTPDIDYRLAQPTYNSTSKMVSIYNDQNIFCFDLETMKLRPPVEPSYKKARIIEDAQSGQIKHLEVWENILIGYAQDLGCFAFDLSDPSAIKPILPYAEIADKEEGFHSLFVLPSAQENKVQVIQPSFTDGSLEVNPLFKTPQEVAIDKTKDERIFFFREKNRTELRAYYLSSQQEIPVPPHAAALPPDEIQERIKKMAKPKEE